MKAQRFIARLFPSFWGKAVPFFGYIPDPREVGVTMEFYSSEWMENLEYGDSFECIEEPIIAELERTGWGEYDGHGQMLDGSMFDVTVVFKREHLNNGIAMLKRELAKLGAPADTRIFVHDFFVDDPPVHTVY